jgi:hypothetical protein
MSDPIAATDATPEPTEARFTLRSILIVMAVVAVIVAAIGPWIRGLAPEERQRLFLMAGLWLVATCAGVGIQIYRRSKLERMAGRTLMRLPKSDETIPEGGYHPRLHGLWASIASAGFALVATRMVLDASQPDMFTVGVGLALTANSVWCATRTFSAFCWGDFVRVGELGVLHGEQILRWDHVLKQEWLQNNKLLKLNGLDQKNAECELKLPVPRERQSQLQAIVQGKLVTSPVVAAIPVDSLDVPALEIGRLSLTVAVRHPMFLPYLCVVVLGVVIVVAVMFVLPDGVLAIPGFSDSWIWGLLAWSVFGAWWDRTFRVDAGAPLVRLPVRSDWREIAVYLVAASGLYLLCWAIGPFSGWIQTVVGVTFGYMVAATFSNLVPRRTWLDLRANGVMLHGSFYWPWSEVRLIDWESKGVGRLVLGSRWRRAIAYVPDEHRELVERILADKVGVKA